MASLMPKTSRGHKYWYIVESRRVNGKPRPVVLAYLGKAEDLLRRLEGLGGGARLKSYAHGAVAALLCVAGALDVPAVINAHVLSPRPYRPEKPRRHGLTVGATLLLGALGRVCTPTSKRGWWEWAKTTSCEYLLRAELSGVDSQHFWDLMDALPAEALEALEAELLERVARRYGFSGDTLLYDTTNFFTFIATANARCSLARRGKNKQKRNDLRQVGLALVVTREDRIPLFHLTYEGNRGDAEVFGGLVERLKQRMEALALEADNHTLVFDRGNNSKKNLDRVAEAGLHYVGALTPYQHPALLAAAADRFTPVPVGDDTLEVFRTRQVVWGRERTLLVFVSDRLKAGQARGLHAALRKAEEALERLSRTINAPSQRSQDRKRIEARIEALLSPQFVKGLVDWSLAEAEPGPWRLTFAVSHKRLAALEKDLGFRIVMTDRHEWQSADIIGAFHGQAHVERAFRGVKDPHHLALRPQFHWTDQKIKVHYFMCVLGYLLTSLLAREARTRAGYTGSLDSLLDTLTGIRLAACVPTSDKRGRRPVLYQLEEMDDRQRELAHALGILEAHIRRPELEGISVYTAKDP